MWKSEFLPLRRDIEFLNLPIEGGKADLQRLRGQLFVELIQSEDVPDILAFEVIDSLLHRPLWVEGKHPVLLFLE